MGKVKKLFICLKCGYVGESFSKIKKCEYCGYTKFKNLGKTPADYWNGIAKMREYDAKFLKEYDIENNPAFDREAYNKRLIQIAEDDREDDERMARLEEQWKKEEEEEQRQAEERKKERIMSNAKDKNHIPRCPTCGSQDLNRLSPANINGAFTLEAQLLAHIAMQLQKTFECNNCGYRW